MTFLDEGSTRRKEIIAKFLDLEQFDRKFKLAKEDSIDARGALKKLEDRNYDEEYEEAVALLGESRTSLTTNKSNCAFLEEEISSLNGEITMLQGAIDSMPATVIDLAATKKDLSTKHKQLISLKTQTREYKQELQDAKETHKKIAAILTKLDIGSLNQKQSQINVLSDELATTRTSIDSLSGDIETSEKKTTLLDGIPCGDGFPSCKFIRDANAAVGRLPVLLEERTTAQLQYGEIETNINALQPEYVTGMINKYNTFVDDKAVTERQIESLGLTIERNQSAADKLKIEIEQLNGKIADYNDNREVI